MSAPGRQKSPGGGGLILPDGCNSSGGLSQEVMMKMMEAQVIQGYRAPGQQYHAPPVEWVKNTLDGSVLTDHKGYPISVNRLLATRPLRAELSSRPGPGGKKLTYISGEGVTRALNEIFGFDGWNMEIVKTQREVCNKDDKGRFHVAYTAHVRLTHKKSGTYKEDVGSSDSVDRTMGTAVSHALKGSITDALKRAARHFGEKLGNTLYVGDFTINKAPLTLRDALDFYDNERENTKFGPSTKPIHVNKETPSPLVDQKNGAASGNRNVATVGSTKTHQQQPMAQPNNNYNKPSAVSNQNKNNSGSAVNNMQSVSIAEAHPRTNGRSSLDGRPMVAMGAMVTKTPSNNPQLAASKQQNPIVSATPKVPNNARESQESLKSRLGPAPNFQLPPPSRQSSSYAQNASLRPPPSAADRLSSGNMFAGGLTFDHDTDPQRGHGNQRVVAHANKENSQGRPSQQQHQQGPGLLKRHASVPTDVGTNKRMNANPYQR
ncbi:repair protein RAD52 homolog [Seminavis robusta]|uniref:Repair protein RAD52 homolog n=1 Tax=Seminavis robusta TaxID=568900 RepID=A0A9N8E7F2_9STRA|nr:repair protein RAD52 homolog [Seminavis robusta]|eukprot:Sro624_g177390.1 repair protein RAD52 homolog (490) ;mRNA; f:44753-46222